MPQHPAAASRPRPGWGSMCGLQPVAGKSCFSISSCQQARKGMDPGSPLSSSCIEPQGWGRLCRFSFAMGSSDKLLHLSKELIQGSSWTLSKQQESVEKYRSVVVGPWYIIHQPTLCIQGPPIPSLCFVPYSFDSMALWYLSKRLSFSNSRKEKASGVPASPTPSWSVCLVNRLTLADQHWPFWAWSYLHFVLNPKRWRMLCTKQLPEALGQDIHQIHGATCCLVGKPASTPRAWLRVYFSSTDWDSPCYYLCPASSIAF